MIEHSLKLLKLNNQFINIWKTLIGRKLLKKPNIFNNKWVLNNGQTLDETLI